LDDRSINGAALKRMFKQIIANNRAGGWRNVKAQAAATTANR